MLAILVLLRWGTGLVQAPPHPPANPCRSLPTQPCPCPLTAPLFTGGRGPISSNRRMFLRLGVTDEFYNITLERPPGDTKGYDALFVNVS